MRAPRRGTTRGPAPGAAVWLALLAVLPSPATAEPAPAAADAPPLRVDVAPLAAAAEWKGDQPVGSMIDLWHELAARIGRRTEFVRADGFAHELAAITDGTADVALGPMAITAERERIIDLTHSIVHSGLRIAVHERRTTGLRAALMGLPLGQLLGLTTLVLVLAVLSGHLLWVFERGPNPGSFPERYPAGMWEAVWWIASTVVTGGCDNKHVASMLGRTVAFAWMVGGIMLVAAFTGVLTASMTAERVTGSIRGARDLPGRVVGCQEQSVVVTTLRSRGAVPREYKGVREALAALQAGDVEAVVAESQQLLTLLRESERHDIVLAGPIFENFDYGIGLPAGSPLREPLNAAILQMREDGTLDKIMTRWFGRHD